MIFQGWGRKLILRPNWQDVDLKALVCILTAEVMIDAVDVSGPWSHLGHVGNRKSS